MLCSSVSTSKQVQTMTVEFAVDLGNCLSWRMPKALLVTNNRYRCLELTNLAPSCADCLEILGTLTS